MSLMDWYKKEKKQQQYFTLIVNRFCSVSQALLLKISVFISNGDFSKKMIGYWQGIVFFAINSDNSALEVQSGKSNLL